jgi:2-dehydro-3-deoxyphosphooctonate aldolase (KDO 8-P synthase)
MTASTFPSHSAQKTIEVQGPNGPIHLGNHLPLTVIAGPCVIEGRQFALDTAFALKEIFAEAGISFLYKSSFDKANRSSVRSFRGVGMEEGLSILAEVRETVGVPVLTDVHEKEQIEAVAQVVDMLQTPAFLCRQTDFIRAVAAAGKPVNLKKGQFLSPDDMRHVLDKARSSGNENIALCERGTSFGYGNLVVDFKTFATWTRWGHPVVFDATHSVQEPGGLGDSTGGKREFVAHLARAAVATGISTVFMECHPDPDHAPCDGPNMLSFDSLPAVLEQLKALDQLVKSFAVKD